MQTRFHNIFIKGIAACVPSTIEANVDLPFSATELQRIIQNSGITQRHISPIDCTAADLCMEAASKLLAKLSMQSLDVDVLIFVTQYPDHLLPSTAHIIKKKLNLKHECTAIQINEGCAAYGYGMQLACQYLQYDECNNALVLVGDTPSKAIDKNDQATRPLFGDAGTATFLSKGYETTILSTGSDGTQYGDIIIKDGYREGFSTPRLQMDGMNVFMFGIDTVPKIIKKFLEESNQNVEDFDFVILHQANKMMNDRIVKKVGFDKKKSLECLAKYGNTGGASIPLSICANKTLLDQKSSKILCCGFGTGLSWATMSATISATTEIMEVITYLQ